MGALTGVRVVEFTLGIHGPYAGMLLADMGADVIKVEPPDGDINRVAAVVEGPYAVGSQFYACNRNKRVVCLNLRTAEGLAAAKQLVATADVVLENMRGGVLNCLGLDYETLSADNPRLVYASASGHGPKGPKATMASIDIIAQAEGGMAAHSGTPETGPLPGGTAQADHAGALFLALGTMFALYARERTGRGQLVQTSLLGSQIGMQAWELSHYLLGGGEPPQGGKGHALAGGIWRVFDAADGSFALAWVTDARWQALCTILERPDLADDSRFATVASRLENTEALVPLLTEAFAERPLEELLRQFAETDQVFSRASTYEDLANDPQVEANEYLISFESEHGTLQMMGFPIALSETPASVRSRPPDLDQHTVEVLSEIDYEDAVIGEMFATGAAGHPAE